MVLVEDETQTESDGIHLVSSMAQKNLAWEILKHLLTPANFVTQAEVRRTVPPDTCQETVMVRVLDQTTNRGQTIVLQFRNLDLRSIWPISFSRGQNWGNGLKSFLGSGAAWLQRKEDKGRIDRGFATVHQE